MILSTCPRCSESLRVPEADLPSDAYAQCPWCKETFPASDITRRLPPIVLLLDAQGQPLEVQPAAVGVGAVAAAGVNPFSGAVVDDHIDDAGDGQYLDELSFENEPAAAAAVDIQIGTPRESAAAGDHPPMRVRTRQSSRKKGSPIRTALGVVFGGLLAFPLAGAILLAFGKAPNLGFWPFDGTYNQSRQRSAAPVGSNRITTSPSLREMNPRNSNSGGSLLDNDSDVAKAVNGITGNKSSGAELEFADERTSANQNSMNLPPDSPSLDQFAQPGSSDVNLNDILMTDPSAAAKGNDPEELAPPEGVALYPNDTQAVSKPAEMEATDASKSQLELKPSSIVIREPDKAADVDAEKTELALPADPLPKLPLEPTKPTDSPELLASINAASDSMSQLQKKRDASAGSPRDLAMTYVAIAAVGIHDADPNSDSLAKLLSDIAASPLLEDLSIAGPQWWNFSTRPNNGMLLIGTLSGDPGAMTITLQGKDNTAEVPVVLPPGVSPPESDRVIAVGLIAPDNDGKVVQIKAIQSLP